MNSNRLSDKNNKELSGQFWEIVGKVEIVWRRQLSGSQENAETRPVYSSSAQTACDPVMKNHVLLCPLIAGVMSVRLKISRVLFFNHFATPSDSSLGPLQVQDGWP